MPSDLTSYYVYELGGTKRFVEVPVFTNILLFDELNRTHPRVQLALFQVITEYNVSVDGVTHNLVKPFHVIVTEIPMEKEVGDVDPLTLTLRDRFLD